MKNGEQKDAYNLLQNREQAFKQSITQNQFRSTFTKLSKQKKCEMPDIYNLKKDTPVDIFKPKDGQYQNLNFKPKMNLTNKEFYQPLQFVLRPRKIKVDEKKEEEQIVVGKKPSMKIFESKQNPKPLKNIYKFQVDESNWVGSVKPPRSSMNPLHLVPNPSETKDDLEIKKAQIQLKNIKIPLKNEFIGNQMQNNEENVQKQTQELEQQFKNNENLQQEFQEFLLWQQKNQNGMRRTASQSDFFRNSNIVDQEHITQIAKCLILTHHNSPSNLKYKKVITLGRPGDDFLRVTKYRDQIYFENKMQKDKVNQNWNETDGFIEQFSSSMSSMKGSQSLKFSRLSKGVVNQYKPDLKCVYPLKIIMNKNKRLDVSVKRFNRKRVDYLNQIYTKHMMAYLYSENKQPFPNEQNPDQQTDYGFEDLQNGIYVTALSKEQQYP